MTGQDRVDASGIPMAGEPSRLSSLPIGSTCQSGLDGNWKVALTGRQEVCACMGKMPMSRGTGFQPVSGEDWTF